jgi:Leucine-rich repeat (LRR) protein
MLGFFQWFNFDYIINCSPFYPCGRTDTDLILTQITLPAICLLLRVRDCVHYRIELKFLDLSGNHLSGEIPEEFVTLTNLETLLLDDNDLVGTLPPLVCSLRDKGTLKTLTSDCNTNKVACSCCTNCVIQMPDVTPDDGHFNLTPRQTLLLDKLMQLSGESAVTTEGTVQHKAARWLMKVDEMDLDANSPNLFQRYTLAVLYYMMPDDNKCFLMKKDENECDWKGNYVEGIAWDRISCDANDHLNYLKLEKCNLGGLIPSEIESFSKLDYLDLSQNKLTGQVPSGYQNLHQLVHMYLDDNKMDGQVPSGVCQLRETAALQSFVTDCLKDDLRVHCDCCTNCPSPAGNEQVPGNHLVGLDSRELAIMNKLKEISGNAVADEGTPQHRAAHFLMKQDGMKLTASSTNLYQRYVVTLLGEMSDLDNKCFERQSGISECQWISKGVGGVTWDRIACDSDGVVEYLKLGMYSYFAPLLYIFFLSLSQEITLTRIFISDHCGISGNIPSELKVLTALNYLDLSKNSFDGIVPFELSTLHNLGK